MDAEVGVVSFGPDERESSGKVAGHSFRGKLKKFLPEVRVFTKTIKGSITISPHYVELVGVDVKCGSRVYMLEQLDNRDQFCSWHRLLAF